MLNCAASLALSAQSRCVSLCSIHDARSVAERQITRRLGYAKIKNKLLILHFARLAVILHTRDVWKSCKAARVHAYVRVKKRNKQKGKKYYRNMSSLFGKILDTRPRDGESTRGHIEVLDTTLRDGEQTSGVSFSPAEKLSITRLLLNNLHVPRIEVCSARVSAGEFESARAICQWASEHGLLERVEMLGYIDGGKSAEWVKRAGGKVINLLV